MLQGTGAPLRDVISIGTGTRQSFGWQGGPTTDENAEDVRKLPTSVSGMLDVAAEFSLCVDLAGLR
jgi:hypothetical protein